MKSERGEDESSDKQDSLAGLFESELNRTRSLCDATLPLIGVAGAAVTLMGDRGSRELVYATGPVAQELDELQFTIGEGPCIDAFAYAKPVLCDDVSDHDQVSSWPSFAAEATRTGARALFAFPLLGGSTPFGVFEMHRMTAGALDGRLLSLALLSVEAVADAVLDELSTQPTTDRDSTLSRAPLFARPEVNQAAGMMAIQLSVPVGEALARLRAYAFAEQIPIHKVALDVVERRLRFDPGPTITT